MGDIMGNDVGHIELCDEEGNIRPHNTQAMPNSDIADLLNEYNVTYKGQIFTGSVVNRIRDESDLMSLIVPDACEEVIMHDRANNAEFESDTEWKEDVEEGGEDAGVESINRSMGNLKMEEPAMGSTNIGDDSDVDMADVTEEDYREFLLFKEYQQFRKFKKLMESKNSKVRRV
jgi:hypothetical protein